MIGSNNSNTVIPKIKPASSTSKKSVWNVFFIGFLTMTVLVTLLTFLLGFVFIPRHVDNNSHNNRNEQHQHAPPSSQNDGREKSSADGGGGGGVLKPTSKLINTYDKLEQLNYETDRAAEEASTEADTKLLLRRNEKTKKQQQQQQEEEEQNNKTQEQQNYYMLFSTGCTPFQNYQALAFFYFARKVEQPGTIIRLVSGCTDAQAADLHTIHETRVVPMQLSHQKFEMHVTPDFGSGTGDQKYWNKPHGILHWMEVALGFEHTVNTTTNTKTSKAHALDDAIIIIVDPDMMLLRPITSNFDTTNYVGRWVSSKNVRHHQAEDTTPVDYTRDHVRHGHPYAQKYGFGAGWLTSLVGEAGDNKLIEIVGPQSPALDVSIPDAADYYPAGPPYVATAKDMYQLAKYWVQFLPAVYQVFPHFMAEMHGYSIAAAHLRLPHKLAEGFMVSDVTAGGEYFDFIDDNLNTSTACMSPPNFNHPESLRSFETVGIAMKSLPFVLHYCQRYALGRYFYSKYKFRENEKYDMFTNCSAPLLREPPKNLAELYDWYIFPNGVETMDFTPLHKNDAQLTNKRKEHVRNGWMVCMVIFGINEAVQYSKETTLCGPADEFPQYYNKTYHFHGEQNFTQSLENTTNPFH